MPGLGDDGGVHRPDQLTSGQPRAVPLGTRRRPAQLGSDPSSCRTPHRMIAGVMKNPRKTLRAQHQPPCPVTGVDHDRAEDQRDEHEAARDAVHDLVERSDLALSGGGVHVR